MKDKTLLLLARIYFIWIGLFHLLVGLLGTFSDKFLFWVSDFMWNSMIEFTPQHYLTTKILLAYTAGFGLSVLFLSMDPRKYKIFILFPIITLIIEILGMFILFNDYTDAFKISYSVMVWNIMQSIILLIIFIFFYIMIKEEKQ